MQQLHQEQERNIAPDLAIIEQKRLAKHRYDDWCHEQDKKWELKYRTEVRRDRYQQQRLRQQERRLRLQEREERDRRKCSNYR
ncbi:unnamed protein product [Didymodactylos carnosus]|nr:unnamed protein product [Didymodactylos carnosus]CAF4077140.1 unnamed protein product [Didymodactylos carnosus]